MIALDSYITSANCLGHWIRERDGLMADMVADLQETGNFRNRADAVRQLHHDGYKVLDVLVLVDQAIYLCKQEIVAREFLES